MGMVMLKLMCVNNIVSFYGVIIVTIGMEKNDDIILIQYEARHMCQAYGHAKGKFKPLC